MLISLTSIYKTSVIETLKEFHSVFTASGADSSLIPQAGRKIQTSAGRNGLQINSQLIRVSKHSIVSHRSPASESGIFLLSELLKMEFFPKGVAIENSDRPL